MNEQRYLLLSMALVVGYEGKRLIVYLYSLYSRTSVLNDSQETRDSSDPSLFSRVFVPTSPPPPESTQPYRSRVFRESQGCFSPRAVGFCSSRHIFRKLLRKNSDRGASRGESSRKKAGDREKADARARAFGDGRVSQSVGLFVLPVRTTATAYEGERILGGVVNFSTKLPFSSFFCLVYLLPPVSLERTIPRYELGIYNYAGAL